MTAVQRLKSALWYAVGQIVDEECLRRNRNATPQFIGALTEMVWMQIGRTIALTLIISTILTKSTNMCHFTENVATDLESFANHASRTTVTTDDVLLLARKNPDLHTIMEEFIGDLKVEREALKGKAKGKAARR